MKRIITLIALLTLLVTGLQAQIIDATNNSSHKQEKPSNNSPLYKPTGHYLRFEAGYPHYASVAYAYQINSYIMLGGGLGYGAMSYYNRSWGEVFDKNHYYNYVRKEGGSGIPFFLEAIFSTPKYKWAFLTDIKVGYSIPLSEYQRHYPNSMGGDRYESKTGIRFYGAINLGVSYKNIGLFAGISSNSFEWWSVYLSYNLPLKIH